MQGWNEIKRLALEKISNSLEICLFSLTHVNFQYFFVHNHPAIPSWFSQFLRVVFLLRQPGVDFLAPMEARLGGWLVVLVDHGHRKAQEATIYTTITGKKWGKFNEHEIYVVSKSPNVFGEMYRNMWRAPKMAILWHMWTIITSVEHRYPAFSPFQVTSWCQHFAVGRRSGRQGLLRLVGPSWTVKRKIDI